MCWTPNNNSYTITFVFPNKLMMMMLMTRTTHYFRRRN